MAIDDRTFLHTTLFSDLSKWSATDAVFTNAKNRYPLVPLSKVLRRVKEPIIIEDDVLYKRITVRLYGKGILQRDEVLGKEIGTKRQFVAHAGQLIISRIDARNGAFGILPDYLDGAIVTNDFWAFEAQNALPEYLMLVLSSNPFQQYWQTISSGTTNRQRVDERSFLLAKIVMPDISDQEKIANQYNNNVLRAEELEETACLREEELFLLWDRLLGIEESERHAKQGFGVYQYKDMVDWLCGTETLPFVSNTFRTIPIKRLCNVNSGGTPSRSNPSFYAGTIPWVKSGEVNGCEITDTEEKITEEAIEKSSARVYQPGSIIVAMYGQTRGQTAKLMINAATNQACAVLHHIDNNLVLTDYLWFYLQGQYHRIREMAVGSAQPNLNAQMIKDYPVVLPPIFSSSTKGITQERVVLKIRSEKRLIRELYAEANGLREQARHNFELAVFGELLS